MKDATWDLSIFYSSFEDPAIRTDIEKIRSSVAEVTEIIAREDKPVSKLEALVDASERISTLVSRIYSFAGLTAEADHTNEAALRLLDELGMLMVEVRMANSAIIRYVGSIDHPDEVIAQSEKLTANGFYLKDLATAAKYMLPADMEKWILRMSLNGGDAFSKMCDRLTGTLTVEMDGKSYPLPAVRGMAHDADPAVRKAAYEAELASYKKIEAAMAYSLSCIKGERLTVCEMKGYSDPLTAQLIESRMDKETLDAMLTAIREALPDFRCYMRRKAEMLGHANGLPFYDLFAPMGKSNRTYTIDEAHDLLVKAFSEIDPAMGEFIDHAFNNRWIDFYPREGKSGGAFCSGVYEKDQSRVLTNFVGSFSDVCTIAHELGHAWHNRQLHRKPLLMNEIPMQLAETASIFNETLLTYVVRKNADEDTRFTILEGMLQDVTQTVVDIYSRFLFESSVFEARKTHIPSADELNKLMLKAQEESYGEGLDPDVRHCGMWICKSHYYSTDLHFYNFPYAFGHLFGLGVFRLYQEQGAAFLPKYNDLLASCGSGMIADVAASVGIDVRSVDYWRSALDVVREMVDEFITLSEKQ